MKYDFTGYYVKPDEWVIGENLLADDGFKDSSFAGCEYRLPAHDYKLAVNIKVTGRKSHYVMPNWYRTRIKIELVGDGSPSEFMSGWVYGEFKLDSK